MADDATATEEAPPRSPPTTAARRCWRCSPSTSATPSSTRHIKPGPGPLGPRRHRRLGRRRRGGRATRPGCRFFDFLSAIDWLPSPYGRYEDSAVDVPFPPPMPDRSAAVPGYAGGDTRFQVLASVAKAGHRPAGAPQGRRARRRPPRRHLDPRLRRRRLARARGARDVRHHLRRQPRPAPHLPPDRVRGPPAPQGVPAARPRREAVAGHRRRRAHAGRGRRRGRGRPRRGRDA